MQVSTAAHQTADQVQQKGKRISENVRQQVCLSLSEEASLLNAAKTG